MFSQKSAYVYPEISLYFLENQAIYTLKYWFLKNQPMFTRESFKFSRKSIYVYSFTRISAYVFFF